jgi:2-dehydropantoate 2-reductase
MQPSLMSENSRKLFAKSPILIWGAGAIGGCVAAFFAKSAVPTIVVDRSPEHVQAINLNGLKIQGPVTEFIQPLKAVLPEDLHGVFQCIFLAVKAQDTREAVQQILPHLSDDGVVVSLQNGLNENLIAAIVGKSRTVSGFVNFAADFIEPGTIDYGNRGAIKVGEMKPELTPRVLAIGELLQCFDTDAVGVADIAPYKWGKLTYGCALFATALVNETMTSTLTAPEHQLFFVSLIREVLGVAALEGIKPLGFDGFEPSAFSMTSTEAESRQSLNQMGEHYRFSSKQRSGVWRDLAIRKRKTEADSQIMEIVHVARSKGFDAPITMRLVEMIREIEQGKRPIQQRNLKELSQLFEMS